MAEDEGRDGNRGRRSRTVGIAGGKINNAIGCNRHRMDTAFGDDDVSARLFGIWVRGGD